MNLDETQKKKVSAWIDEGLKLADIQKRLETEFGFRVTYLEVRLLVDDLKLKPKDPAPPAPPPKPLDAVPAAEPEPALGGDVSVTVDALPRPGTLVSGKVKFSDGKTGDWYLDQNGRLGVAPMEKGYKPSPADVEIFQRKLQEELQKLGL